MNNFTANGTRIIHRFEGCKLKAYPDPGPTGLPWTIGRGHTKGVTPDMVITQDQADEFTKEDLEEFSAIVSSTIKASLNDDQFSAVVCFAFNVKSWKDTPLIKLISAGNFGEAMIHWLRYCKADGVEMSGLENRRKAELALFKGDFETLEILLAD
jgi:lysozyme